ncbi:ATP-binding protein [Sporosarcina sp. JAI121]|uniref:ATP-binding protein n=1 Tax=Sporosarcina sp. JAI121 TaxID=2723064 RepID=UPI0015CCBC8E|nr:ATP-binding protein [Sporosarcina sp. JAI121]NYF24051.1 two-component system, sporulation sensor kinase E [Sporosarcina sp. JAI121]
MKYQKENVMDHITFILDNSIRPGIVFDNKETFVYVNKSFEKYFAMNGKCNIKDLFINPSNELWENITNQINKHENKTLTVNVQLVDGRIYGVKMHLMYFEDIQQTIALFDIPQNYMDSTGKTYIKAFHNSDDFMIVVNKHGRIFDVNEKHTTFLNVPRDYLMGKSVQVILELFNVNPKILVEYIRDLAQYNYAEMTLLYEISADEKRNYQVFTLFDSETQTYLIRMKDQTETMAMEKLLAHSDSLSTIGELAASIAHEIRNPMTTLKGFVQLLKITATKDTMKYLSVIDEEILRMESILTEMLILSKPALNKKTTFSLEVLVTDMLQVIQPKALMDGIMIKQQENTLKDSLIFGDSDKLKQVLLNLYKNALEAMSPGGILTIAMEQDHYGKITLRVTDTGKGMDLEQMNQVFVPFFTSKPDGTGLGLPLVLKIIEEHGGTISVESKVGIGTTFIVTFPSAIGHGPEVILNEKSMLLA